jgi:hypothetical protein
MAQITEQHLHHVVNRHHHTMKKFEAMKDKLRGVTAKFVSTLEVGGGAYLGGVIEGRTKDPSHPDSMYGGTILHVPINLGVGALLLAGAHLDLAGREWSDHLNNLGNGFVASYAATAGHNFGDKWRSTGRLFGGAKAPAALPPPGPAAVHGDLSPDQLAAMAARMQQAAQAAG